MIYFASVRPINRETHDPRLEAGLEGLDAGEAVPHEDAKRCLGL
jgi:hypothetical protein